MTSPSDERTDRDRATPDGGGTLIVGGGIAGLALAGLFARSGHVCELIERAGGYWSEEQTTVVNGFESGVTLRKDQRVKLPIERRYERPTQEPPSP